MSLSYLGRQAEKNAQDDEDSAVLGPFKLEILKAKQRSIPYIHPERRHINLSGGTNVAKGLFTDRGKPTSTHRYGPGIDLARHPSLVHAGVPQLGLLSVPGRLLNVYCDLDCNVVMEDPADGSPVFPTRLHIRSCPTHRTALVNSFKRNERIMRIAHRTFPGA
ncbi:hypothetical protein DAEQUDRAFT_422924 [Daedalea quercina L-15889]|uniref:Uncharacterized protein n=1 Tax=Daedalea quercina L-15889 TaxID=1314783 RepID=A0A165TM88_9APHY|nr:hypothetical protein DAEQUDRAFT_422924 [Daedalea quercina L-15889]